MESGGRVLSEKGLTESNFTLRYYDSLYILKCGISDNDKNLLFWGHDIPKKGLCVKVHAPLHIVKYRQWRRVAGRRRSLRSADPIVCQGSLRRERGSHRFWEHYCYMTWQKLKIKEIGSVQGWKDQQSVIEDIMKVQVPGYKLRLEKTHKIETI